MKIFFFDFDFCYDLFFKLNFEKERERDEGVVCLTRV